LDFLDIFFSRDISTAVLDDEAVAGQASTTGALSQRYALRPKWGWHAAKSGHWLEDGLHSRIETAS
jgi:hypothetical protein